MLPSYVEQSVVELGWQQGIPVWQGGSSGEALLDLVRALAPDAIVVACWPTRLPEALLALPRWGCLNVHPSLLPAYRGPAPLFWQLRDGLHTSGVTIHQMSARLDEGPLLAQAPFRLPSGASGEQLDRLAAQLGGQLLGRVLDQMERGRLEPRPQPAGGSYQGWPTEADFVVPTTWSARHAWTFMRGTEEWGIPFTIPLPDGPLVVTRALAVAPRAALRQPVAYRGDQVAVQFSPGVLLVPAEAHHREHRGHRGS